MDALKFLDDFHIREEFQQQSGNEFAVEHRPLLAEAHIVEVVFTSLTFYITEVRMDGRTGIVVLTAHFLDYLLKFASTTDCLVFLNGLTNLILKLVISGSKVIAGG